MSTLPQNKITPDEYLATERKTESKNEYFHGEIFAMSGASQQHALISLNIGAELRSQLRSRDCTAYAMDLRVQTHEEAYVYPDIVVVCGKAQFLDDQKDTLKNPKVIIEVLSPSIQDYDRGMKFEQYRQVASLSEYILVAQDRCHVEHFIRQPDGTWLLAETNNLESILQLPSISCQLDLKEVYQKIDFNPI